MVTCYFKSYLYLKTFFTSTRLDYSLLSIMDRVLVVDLSGILDIICALVNHYLYICVFIFRLMLIICKYKTKGV